MKFSTSLFVISFAVVTRAFQLPRNAFSGGPIGPRSRRRSLWKPLHASPTHPQVFSTGYSPKDNLLEAIQDATDQALAGLPMVPDDDVTSATIDLAIVTISSLYDAQFSPSVVVPAVLSSGKVYGRGIQNLVGCTAGGIVSSLATATTSSDAAAKACQPVESEGLHGVSVTLAILPDVKVKTFHVLSDDVPDDVGRVEPDVWKRAVGLGDLTQTEPSDSPKNTAFMLLPSPAFQPDLEDLMGGLSYSFDGNVKILGGIASTVSSLSRARLFRFDACDPTCTPTLGDGCVGVGLQGDIEVKQMVALGTKPVGGIYRVISSIDSTIRVIQLDDMATQELQEYEEEQQTDEEDEDEEEENTQDKRAQMAAAYAKAAIPKPILAEANFVMRTLSDDDQAFMRKAILVGLERGGSVGRTPSELARLAEGHGHRFVIHQVASAGMKDGSITLPLGSVNVVPGTRLRFFVRESNHAKKEVGALWMGYKKRVLEETLAAGGKEQFSPAAALMYTTLDRGTKFFGGKPGFESGSVSEYVPSLPSISGFFSNGVLGKLDDEEVSSKLGNQVHGSASSYVLIGSASRRPIYSPAQAAAEREEALRKEEDEAARLAEDAKRDARTKSLMGLDAKAPRQPNGELVLKRREVQSGRALTVSTVEWSVAEKNAVPTSTLEGFMWDKETEVDRFRERVPLSNLVSQCRLAASDPTVPKPRDWIGPVREEIASKGFAVIPECKRSEPTTGALRKRYDVGRLVKQFVKAGASALSVNCDAVLHGGKLEDVAVARNTASSVAADLGGEDGLAAPPILASDLIIYPYQLYKFSLGGADAVNLVAGALTSKDLLYLTKIASSLKLQSLISVTSVVQIEEVTKLSKGSVAALVLSNRDLEDYTIDLSGKQALDLLRTDALAAFREKHGSDVPILVEGRVGLIEGSYVEKLKNSGADGAIVGSGLAADSSDETRTKLEELRRVSWSPVS